MSPSVDRWTCATCGRENPVKTLLCAGCGRPLGSDDAVEISGVQMTGRDWGTLLLAPLWVFFGVAGADGRVDHSEVATLRDLHRHAERTDEPLFLAIATVLRADFWGVVDRHETDGRSVRRGLADTRGVLEARLSAPRAERIRVALVRVGVSVARASTLSFLGMGSRIHDDEMRVLGDIAAALGLTGSERRDLGLPPA
ncbi:MAG: hypothetical protein KY453_10130 [Gemmatimonadetes bacterium]|nr:hypothetical protein [Gemmatimonadota bacterium]